ncbi:MAG: hypothetical protein H0W84_02730 [Bacteroidetes bacterium]|nr:hypothetical protein [Bacteroidota bacterium]
MKKPNSSKKSPLKKSDKAKDSGELRKPTKLKPLKEKEKKNWKNNLDEEEEDFAIEEDDVNLEGNFDEEEEEEGFYDDRF